MVKVYWWDGGPSKIPNFGDRLAVVLLDHFAQVSGEWAPPEQAEVISTGSVIDAMPQSGWGGIVAGSGQLNEATRCNLRKATVLGLRGHLTAERAVTSSHRQVVIGDPGLLSNQLVSRQPEFYDVGIVAHVSDTERQLFKRFARFDPLEIDVRECPHVVISKISSCHVIVASSLHGIVVADSLGIARQIERFIPKNPYEGGDYKFFDYSSALGMETTFGKLQVAPVVRVKRLQDDLIEMFMKTKEILECQKSAST